MVLGTSQYKSGVRVTMFARSDRGIGYLAGEGDDAQIVRSVYKDATDAKKIAASARGGPRSHRTDSPLGRLTAGSWGAYGGVEGRRGPDSPGHRRTKRDQPLTG